MDKTEEKLIITEVTKHVHNIADSIDWEHLNIEQRKQYYEAWTADPQIGGRLLQVKSPNSIRVYLKDSVMKAYSLKRRPTIKQLLKSLGIKYTSISKEYEKPQTILCDKKVLYTLTTAREWKISTMSAFERACEVRKIEKNIVFITDYTTGRFVDKEYRDLIDAAARRLDIIVQWLA